MRARGLLYVAGGVLGVYAVASIIQQVNLLKSSEFKLVSAKKTALTLKGVSIDLVLSVKNNSGIAFKVFGQKYDILLNRRSIGHAFSTDVVDILPGKVASFTVKAYIDFQKSLKAGEAVDWNQVLNNVVTFKGGVKTKTFGILFGRIPVSVDFKLKDYISL